MSSVFRDDAHGAEARRTDLLNQRRAELAGLPFEVRRIYVRRNARAIAGAVATAGGAILVLAAASPGLADWLARFLPGPQPAPLASALFASLILTSLTYFIARSFLEDRFTQVMSRATSGSHDLFADIERLSHVHPDRVARRMATRSEMVSVLFPLLGLTLLAPSCAVYLILFEHAGHFPNPALFDNTIEDMIGAALPAHLVLAALSLLFVRRLAALDTRALADGARTGRTVIGVLGGLLFGFFAIPYWPTGILIGLGVAGFAVASQAIGTRVRHERLYIDPLAP